MRDLLDKLRGRAGLRAALLFWGLFLLWETVGVRAVFGAGVTAAGLLDDLAVTVGFLGLFAALEVLPRFPRTLVAAALGLLLGAFVLANTLYFSFFKTFINVDTILLMDQLPDTSSSVWALMTPALVVSVILVPLALLGLALFSSVSHGPRKSSMVVLACVVLAIPSYSLGRRVRSGPFSVAEHNALANVARQGVGRVADDWIEDEDGIRRRIADALTRTWLVPEDEVAGTRPEYPLYKVPSAPAAEGLGVKNVVFVVMESTRAWELGLGTGLPSIGPNLKALSEQGLTFRNAYANGHQTIRGEAAILCSQLPHSGGGPIYARFPHVRIRCLPEILGDHGYETHWISSYTAIYGNKQTFLNAHGVENIHDKDEIERRPLAHPKLGWGASDEDLADFAVDVLDQAQPPFFAEVMTLSNHHPFNHGYPVERPTAVDTSMGPELYRDYLHGIHYTDHAVGRFMDKARTRPWFDDTLFVFVGDHGQWHFAASGDYAPFPVQAVEAYFRTPLIFYAPAHIAPEVRDTVAAQVDIAPTVLDMLGLAEPNAFMGLSLLADLPADQRYAFMGYENGWSLRQGNAFCYAVDATCFEDAPPYCEKGQEPETRPHACFRLDKDLLTLKRDDAAPFSLLDEEERHPLIERGMHLSRWNDFLLRTDSLYPRESEPQPQASR